jgi:hypothetical protein
MIYNCQFAAGQIEMAKFHQRSGNGRHRDRGRLGLATALAEFFCGRGMDSIHQADAVGLNAFKEVNHSRGR